MQRRVRWATPPPHDREQSPHLRQECGAWRATLFYRVQPLQPPACALWRRLSVRAALLLVLSHLPSTHHCSATLAASNTAAPPSPGRTPSRPSGAPSSSCTAAACPRVRTTGARTGPPAGNFGRTRNLGYCLVHFNFQPLPAFVELHPALVIQAVLVLDLLRDESEVSTLLRPVLHALPLIGLEMVFPGWRTTINRSRSCSNKYKTQLTDSSKF